MQHLLVAGAGKIGSLISCLLSDCGDYHVHLADENFDLFENESVLTQRATFSTVTMDMNDTDTVSNYIKQHHIQAIISCLPYYCNVQVATIAKQCGTHYFDLTEDIFVTEQVRDIAQGASTAFVPQCGLAPGFVGIAANDIMQHFDKLRTVKLRVGALPVNSSNALQYSLTWSTDGVINEYGNACEAVIDGQLVKVPPLEQVEKIQIDGLEYEAFNTSGGLGSLAQLYDGKVANMNYKTIRYPGHCDRMRFLMLGLKLNHDRETLKRVLENAIPKTYQDVVLVYVAVTGFQGGQLMEENYVNKIYPAEISGMRWSAIQVTTAAGMCAVVDLVLSDPAAHKGFTYQESFTLRQILDNRFGRYYN